MLNSGECDYANLDWFSGDAACLLCKFLRAELICVRDDLFVC